MLPGCAQWSGLSAVGRPIRSRLVSRLLQKQRSWSMTCLNAGYAAPASSPSTSLGGGTGATGARKGLGATIMASTQTEDKGFVDTNAERLVSYACVNYLKQGEDIELKPDDEYPDWLYELDLNRPATFDEMHPDTHGWLFWQHFKAEYERQKAKEDHLRLTNFYVQHNIRGSYDDYRNLVLEQPRVSSEMGRATTIKAYKYNK